MGSQFCELVFITCYSTKCNQRNDKMNVDNKTPVLLPKGSYAYAITSTSTISECDGRVEGRLYNCNRKLVTAAQPNLIQSITYMTTRHGFITRPATHCGEAALYHTQGQTVGSLLRSWLTLICVTYSVCIECKFGNWKRNRRQESRRRC